MVQAVWGRRSGLRGWLEFYFVTPCFSDTVFLEFLSLIIHWYDLVVLCFPPFDVCSCFCMLMKQLSKALPQPRWINHRICQPRRWSFRFLVPHLCFQKLILGPGHLTCKQLLRNLLKNRPRYTYIAINIALLKARYRCHAGFVLSGKEMRTCKDGRWIEEEDGRWIEEEEPVCMGKMFVKELLKISWISATQWWANESFHTMLRGLV